MKVFIDPASSNIIEVEKIQLFGSFFEGYKLFLGNNDNLDMFSLLKVNRRSRLLSSFYLSGFFDQVYCVPYFVVILHMIVQTILALAMVNASINRAIGTRVPYLLIRDR